VCGNKEHLLSPCGGFVPKALHGKVRSPLAVSSVTMRDCFSHMLDKSSLLLSWVALITRFNTSKDTMG